MARPPGSRAGRGFLLRPNRPSHTSALGIPGVEQAAADLLATSSLTPVGEVAVFAATSLVAVATLSADANTLVSGEAALTAAATLAAPGLVDVIVTGLLASVTTAGAAGEVTASAVVIGPLSIVTVAAPTGAATVTAVVTGLLGTITMAAPTGATEAYTVDRSGDVVTLTLLDLEVPAQPGTLRGAVGNGTPGGVAYFFLDSSTTAYFSIALDEFGGAGPVALPIGGLTVGSHTVKVGASSTVPTAASSSFTVLTAPLSDTPPTPVEPPAVTTGRWTFQAFNFLDVQDVPTYEFAFNPSKFSQTFGQPNLTTGHTTAVEGQCITWEGALVPPVWRWSGNVFTRADHDALLTFARLNSRVWLTDEFGRRYLVKIESLSFTRKRDTARPWHHEYQMAATVLAGQGVLA